MKIDINSIDLDNLDDIDLYAKESIKNTTPDYYENYSRSENYNKNKNKRTEKRLWEEI